MKRKIDYLFQRPGSRNWWLRLQGPDKRTEKSLKTPDRVQAEILALPEIAKHKASLLALRPHLESRGDARTSRACMMALTAVVSPRPKPS